MRGNRHPYHDLRRHSCRRLVFRAENAEKSLCRRHTRKYLRPDGVRSVAFEFQETIDQKLVQILREDEVTYHDHKVMSDTVQTILDYHRTHIGPLQRRIPGM